MPKAGADSHRALEALVEQYAGLIRRVVARVAGPRLSALHEDIAQQVVVNLWRQLDREQTIEYPASYIYRASVREAARALRQAAALGTVSLDDAGEGADRSDPAPTPEEALAARQRARYIAEALTSLRPDRRKAVRAHLAGFSVAEIMEMHGWPYQTARNLIARGVRDLRAKLRPENSHD